MDAAPDASAANSAMSRSTREEGKAAAAVAPEENWHRWVALSFCGLCFLQVALNIFLHLAFRAEGNCQNLTAETKGMKKISDGNQTDDREELIRNLTLQQSSLAVERDVLRKKLDDFIYYSQHGWVYFNGSFYYISSIMKTWQQSREDCQQKKVDLIIINSKKEQDFFQKFRSPMWIGLSDRQTEGVWKWVDRTPLTKSVSFWGPDEPNSYEGRNEDCAVTGYHSGEKSWNDDRCTTENFWICEKTMSL
ncbi:C-type lectin domain family 4 member M-like isoform X2 [Betta splendens]|uniref:C-type lectin domain family 4 member M-like isoform X2 n=1 Tax=Betta splendens TaxID=158456 RepID=A0A6P7NQL4_BETSP|nr:C-type lectin domain family 4 member M-like isoform X2 [Betta splendens]